MPKYAELTETQKDEVWNRVHRLKKGYNKDMLLLGIFANMHCPYCYEEIEKCKCEKKN